MLSISGDDSRELTRPLGQPLFGGGEGRIHQLPGNTTLGNPLG